ncbi:MAG: 4-(cytidine 5'-diphospho)-2-C-methyl-D-erythritol kinase [Bacteroidetes bacterium]|nr:4-(cytidine 5'-diphospho)-2-C-methyl-D-erythritol kinase [Bacteroidota bacterium]
MLVFPNCKINLGLNIVQKRADGFHDIETVFYPVNWCDALEIIEGQTDHEPFTFSQSGILIQGKKEENLIYKAWQFISEIKAITPIKVHLHKTIPMGAGLGGGSADAAFLISLLNQKFKLGLTSNQTKAIATRLGSDCSFFTENKPVLATCRGDLFSPVKIDLSPYYILVVYPGINSNTKEAYTNCKPKAPAKDLRSIIENIAVEDWKNYLTNDFENTVFIKYPEIKKLKEDLYNSGAIYACMSGSGSSVFGIFKKEPMLNFDKHYNFYLQTPVSKIL